MQLLQCFVSLERHPCFVCLDPFMLPKMQVDKGAIRFILSGANIMCPGLTSPGAKMTNVASDTVVVSFLQALLPFFFVS